MLIKLIKFEIQKTFRKPRSFIGIIAILAMVGLIMFSIWFRKGETAKMIGTISDAMYTQGNVINVYFVSFMLMNTLFIHLPLLITLVCGDLLAGESNGGTWRLLLIRPISRAEVLNAKFATAMLYTFLLVALLAGSSFLIGQLLFGSGDLIVTRVPVCVFEEGDIVWRFVCAYGFGLLSMGMIASLSLMLSNFASNSIGPIIGTMVIILIFTILGNLNTSFFDAIKPGLFTTYTNTWSEFFSYEIDKTKIYRSIFVLAAHIAVFYGITYYTFTKKDILT